MRVSVQSKSIPNPVVKTLKEETVSKPYIIAVDGPAGSGKSSICAQVAEAFNIDYLNTGILYRTLGYVLSENDIALEDEESIKNILNDFCDHLNWCGKDQKVYWDGIDITERLQDIRVSILASAVAKLSYVRDRLLPVQRTIAQRAKIATIIDGRDIGTIVFPDADVKIFLTASIEKRARRRLMQLQEKNMQKDWDLPSLSEVIRKRDEQDRNREIAPLRQAEDAFLVDNSEMSFSETISYVKDLICSRISLN